MALGVSGRAGEGQDNWRRGGQVISRIIYGSEAALPTEETGCVRPEVIFVLKLNACCHCAHRNH